MEYPIHFFATFPRNFIKTVTDWGEVPWLSKDFFSCYKIIRHERSMLFIAWLFFFLSFFFISFVRWRCKMLALRSASSKAVIIHAPGYGVGYSWGEKQFEQFSPSHLVIGLILWTPNHTLVQAICRTNLQQQTCTWTHKSPC